MSHLRDEHLIEAFVARGQRDPAVLSEAQLDGGWERLQRSRDAGTLRQPKPSRRLGLVLATALAAAAVALVAYRLVPARPGAPLQYALEGAVTRTTNPITSAPNAGSRLHFTDDSRIDLAASTTVSVDALAEDGAQVALIDGVIDVFVKPRAHSAWTFTAGPFRVKVKGTSFRLGYSSAQQRMRLHMTSGLVEVLGSRGRAMAVSAGESVELVAEPTAAAGRYPQDATVPPSASEGAAPPLGEAHGKTAIQGARANAAVGSPHRKVAVQMKADREEPPAERPAIPWSKLITQGRYSEVIAEAQNLGIDVTLAQASAADLSSLADAARYTKRHDLARAVLLAMRARFTGTEPARDASFFLGRLGEAAPGQPEGALGWYETYLREAPRGVYASEALAREMTLLAAKDRGRARKVAKLYLERFPRGAEVELARSLLETGND